MKNKTTTVKNLIEDPMAVQAILFKQGRIIHSIRAATEVDESYPTELIPEMIEHLIKTNKKLRSENTRLTKKLKQQIKRD